MFACSPNSLNGNGDLFTSFCLREFREESVTLIWMIVKTNTAYKSYLNHRIGAKSELILVSKLGYYSIISYVCAPQLSFLSKQCRYASIRSLRKQEGNNSARASTRAASAGSFLRAHRAVSIRGIISIYIISIYMRVRVNRVSRTILFSHSGFSSILNLALNKCGATYP